MEEKIDGVWFEYDTDKYVYDFQQLQTLSFDDSIVNGKIAIREADERESNLLENILEVNNKVRSRSKSNKKKKVILLKA